MVARSSVPVQTGPGAHRVSCTLGAGFLFRGEKLPGCGVNHPLPSSSEVKEKVVLYLCSPSGPSWPVLGPTLSLPWRLVTLKNMLFYSKVCDAFWPDFDIRDVTWTRTLCDGLSFPFNAFRGRPSRVKGANLPFLMPRQSFSTCA